MTVAKDSDIGFALRNLERMLSKFENPFFFLLSFLLFSSRVSASYW